ncbi:MULTISPECIES: hypothetical protein [unclassified Serratia (in: enterobacteria)]|uniref:hypothetical protein n=1 Tax=unclassified Serratia (in: enterobacteria) TaxID=2647522 RepID=UPI0005056B00|nr:MULTISPECIES: hypothetical protein [unclassified Serratia (in: enterobacteria)]KFK94579.1 hypothetical protein JV45_11715 [Serratia sp. Ag2]KFK95799.1 hypothetical protein IV04_20485 [Serratia sp. Ag1]
MQGLKELSAQLQKIKKQVPFATARALTSVARKIADAQKTAFQRHLDNPTPFTVNSVKSVGARKSNLVAKVFVMDKAASYLEPFEFGGQHKLNSQALLNPKNIKLNKYGNLTRSKMAQLKAKPDVFIGKVGDSNGVWQRVKAKKGKKGKKRRKRSANGTRQERIKAPAPKLLIQFGDALPVTPTLGYMQRAQTMATALMQTELSKAMREALRTAK